MKKIFIVSNEDGAPIVALNNEADAQEWAIQAYIDDILDLGFWSDRDRDNLAACFRLALQTIPKPKEYILMAFGYNIEAVELEGDE